ncbi:hypothetical protein N657DRAFT_690862 [Parathielavia appendiculata]|uniref:Uncharacterized protein n=1 Tax=Parathielavia appendiculata TaxID=2587402 RepID=A0AAN6TYQ4_9PEZI|nr:hypothetical protein N657DRAFT_690862 [Parathielavia appendiculata]
MKMDRNPVVSHSSCGSWYPAIHSRIALVTFFMVCAIGFMCLGFYASNRNRREGVSNRLIQGRHNKHHEDNYIDNEEDVPHQHQFHQHNPDCMHKDNWTHKTNLTLKLTEDGWRIVEEERTVYERVTQWVIGMLHDVGKRVSELVYGASRIKLGSELRLPSVKDVESGGASLPYGYAYAYANRYRDGYGVGDGTIGGQIDGFKAAGEKSAVMGDVGTMAWPCGTFSTDLSACRLRRNGGGTMTVEGKCPV